MRDPRIPLCRVDLLGLGQPMFVRQHPASTGSWLLPVLHDGVTVLTVVVVVASDGSGAIGGSRGGDVGVGTEAAARRMGEVPGDPVVSAELVYAAPPWCAPRDTISWRLVRQSGTVVYYVPAPAPGGIFREDEMRFVSQTFEFRVGPSAKLASAC